MTIDYLQTNQPDVLEVIANLSNDAVFTPPRVVNAVLDLLPEDVWTNPEFRWLDPCSKTGVFPREITKRLMAGLAESIPNEKERLAHIHTNMVFAIATEEITAMMTRRSLYCSKDASSAHSATSFAITEGNVWHQRVEHVFDEQGRCAECKGNREQLEHASRDNKAYGFIHQEGLESIKKEIAMKFDVILGNPPYQMDALSGNRTMPIYNLFVEEAKKLNPRYMAFIVPSRWMAGGLGLTGFREEMLADRRIRKMVDFPNAEEVFPGVGKNIKGGVQYFMWDRDYDGPCSSVVRRGDDIVGPVDRELGQFDVFVRDARALPILQKVLKKSEASMTEILSADKEFGLTSNFSGYSSKKSANTVELYAFQNYRRVTGWMKKSLVTKSPELVDKWKVLVPKAGSDGGQKLPDVVLGSTLVAGPPSVCTQTYLFFILDSENAAVSVDSYIKTRFFRFLVSLRKSTQDATKSTYTWVPQQSWDRMWTDEDLYRKYGITKAEQAYIESMVKEMSA